MISYGNLLAYKLIERVPDFFFSKWLHIYIHTVRAENLNRSILV
jgi:hypothetical protein